MQNRRKSATIGTERGECMPKLLTFEERAERLRKQVEDDRKAKALQKSRNNAKSQKLRAVTVGLYLTHESGIPEALAKACIKSGMTQQDYIRNALIEKLRRNHFLEPKEPE